MHSKMRYRVKSKLLKRGMMFRSNQSGHIKIAYSIVGYRQFLCAVKLVIKIKNIGALSVVRLVCLQYYQFIRKSTTNEFRCWIFPLTFIKEGHMQTSD